MTPSTSRLSTLTFVGALLSKIRHQLGGGLPDQVVGFGHKLEDIVPHDIADLHQDAEPVVGCHAIRRRSQPAQLDRQRGRIGIGHGGEGCEARMAIAAPRIRVSANSALALFWPPWAFRPRRAASIVSATCRTGPLNSACCSSISSSIGDACSPSSPPVSCPTRSPIAASTVALADRPDLGCPRLVNLDRHSARPIAAQIAAAGGKNPPLCVPLEAPNSRCRRWSSDISRFVYS